MRDVLALDLGKTACRAARWRDGARRQADGPGAPGLATGGGDEAAAAAILRAASPLLGDILADTVAVGAAGALADPGAALALTRRLRSAFGSAHILVTSDAVAAHAGALGGAAGVVVSIGTGVVALAVADGVWVQVDGHGPLLGDEGGGAWLGLAALRAVLRAADGRGRPTALADAARARFGPPEGLASLIGREAAPAWLAASFAPDVLRSASAGDPVAAALARRAARAIGESAREAAARMPGRDPVALVLTGGLSRASPEFAAAIAAAATSGRRAVSLRPPLGDALDGARLLALGCAHLYAGRITRLGSGEGPEAPALDQAGAERSRSSREVSAPRAQR